MFSINAALESNSHVVSLAIPATASTVEGVIQGVQAILDSLGIAQAIFLGHSLGGLVVQSFAVRHPQRVAGLALSSTSFYLGPRAVFLPAAASLMARLPETFLLRMVNSQMQRLLRPSDAADFWLQFYREELSQPNAGARVKHQTSLIARFTAFFRDNPIQPALQWVQSVPVQIIASEDDRGFTKREIDHLGRLYPRSRTVTLPTGAGHLSFLTRPREYVQAVQSLVAEVFAAKPI